jgi:hypothetical protein
VLRRLSSLVLTVGLVAGSVASIAFACHVAVLDASTLKAAAPAILETGPVRRAISERIVAELERQAPGTAGLPPEQLGHLTSSVMRDRRFVGAFGDALVDVQRHVFRGARGPVVLAPPPVTAAVRDAMTTAPGMTALPATAELGIVIDAGSVPDLEAVGHGIDATARAGAAAWIASIALGIAGAVRRRRAVARVARWAVGVGLSGVMLLGVVPRLVLTAFGAWPDVAAALLRVSTEALAIAGAGLGVAGAVTLAMVHHLDVAAADRARAHAMAELARRTSWRPPPVERTPRPGVKR